MDRNLYTINITRHRSVVVPYVGTWIEIVPKERINKSELVVPYVGTWIEIASNIQRFAQSRVVPYVGTWIEI